MLDDRKKFDVNFFLACKKNLQTMVTRQINSCLGKCIETEKTFFQLKVA